MKVELEGFNTLDLSSMIRQGVTAAVTSKLEAILPRVLDDIISNKNGKSDIIYSSIREALREEVATAITEYVVACRDDVRRHIRARLEQVITPTLLADQLIHELETAKLTLSPFKKAKCSPPDFDEEE